MPHADVDRLPHRAPRACDDSPARLRDGRRSASLQVETAIALVPRRGARRVPWTIPSSGARRRPGQRSRRLERTRDFAVGQLAHERIELVAARATCCLRWGGCVRRPGPHRERVASSIGSAAGCRVAMHRVQAPRAALQPTRKVTQVDFRPRAERMVSPETVTVAFASRPAAARRPGRPTGRCRRGESDHDPPQVADGGPGLTRTGVGDRDRPVVVRVARPVVVRVLLRLQVGHASRRRSSRRCSSRTA